MYVFLFLFFHFTVAPYLYFVNLRNSLRNSLFRQFSLRFSHPASTTTLIIGDLGVDNSAAALYDIQNGGVGPVGSACAAGSTNGSAAGVTWWSMMNGSLYEESPPPQPPPPPPTATPIKTSPSSTPITTTTSSTSPSSVTSNSGPLHIPAKRLVSYNDLDQPAGGVIRHSHHGAQPWNYSPTVEGHHPPPSSFDQFGAAPTYYNLADPAASRDRKTAAINFWSPAAASGTTPEYGKYSTSSGTPGTSSDPAVSCHQSYSQTWANYAPYSSVSRHHVDPHHHQYLSPSDDRRVAAAMVAESAAGFTHADSYIRSYNAIPSDVPSTPYPPTGMSLTSLYRPNSVTKQIILQ